MADGYARASGEIAAVLVLPWPGIYNRCRDRYRLRNLDTSMIVGLHASLKRIVEGETPIQGHWDRYVWAQQAVRSGLRNIGFEILVDDADASPTVTTVCKRDEMEHEQEVRDYLSEHHNYIVSGTWGVLTGKAFCVAHMGKASSPEYLIPFLLGIKEYVRKELKVDVPVGASLVGMK